MCIDAFAKSNLSSCYFVRAKSYLKKISHLCQKNIIIEDYVDQLDLLQKVDLFITHGA